jgi:hypothetical protein
MTKTRAIELLTQQPTAREINAHLRTARGYAYAYSEQGIFLHRFTWARTRKGTLEGRQIGTMQWVAIPETARIALTWS